MLRDFIADLRDQFERFESTAKNMSSFVSQTYKTNIQRGRRCKKQPDDSSVPDSQSTMSGRQKFQVCMFNVTIDKLVAELDRRYKSYKDLEQSFGFLSNMHTITSEELRSNALCLQKKTTQICKRTSLMKLPNSRTLQKKRKTKVLLPCFRS